MVLALTVSQLWRWRALSVPGDREEEAPRQFELDDLVVAARCFRACTQLAGAAIERDYG